MSNAPSKTTVVGTLPWLVLPVMLGAGTFALMVSRDSTVYGAESAGISPETVRFIISAVVAVLGGLFQSPILDWLKTLFPSTGTPLDLSSIQNLLSGVKQFTPEEKTKLLKGCDDAAWIREQMTPRDAGPKIVSVDLKGK